MGIDITFGKRYIGYTLIDQYQNWNQQNIFKEHRTGKVQRIKANYKIASLVEKKKNKFTHYQEGTTNYQHFLNGIHFFWNWTMEFGYILCLLDDLNN